MDVMMPIMDGYQATQEIRRLKNRKLADIPIIAMTAKLAIGSSSKNAPFILDRIGLSTFFDAVADGNCILRSKPDPEVFLLAASLLKLDPSECIVVEDAHAGVEAAVNGGFRCAAMGDAIDDERATWHLKRFADLLQIVA